MQGQGVFVVLLLGGVLALCSGAGMLTHTEVGYRAVQYYDRKLKLHDIDIRPLILKHQDAFTAGMVWPDIFYNSYCAKGEFHNIAEDMHWVHYIKVAIEYIRELPRPFLVEDEKLLVFLLGAGCHDLADIPWHGLGISDSLIETIKAYDSQPNGHNLADLGGETIDTFEMTFDQLNGGAGPWYIPKRHIFNIWKKYYQGTSQQLPNDEQFRVCTLMMLVARTADKAVFQVGYPSVANKSVVLGDHMNNWMIGGINDMSIMTMKFWDTVAEALDNGTDICTSQDNPLHWMCGDHIPRLIQTSLETYLRESGVNVDSFLRNITVIETEQSLVLSLNHSSLEIGRSTSKPNSAALRTKSSGTSSVSFGKAYSFLGYSTTLEDLNGDGVDDLIIGVPNWSEINSPQHGRVFVKFGRQDGSCFSFQNQKLLEDDDFDLVIESPCSSCHFGAAVTVVDVDLDGQKELVVSAPRYGGSELNYYGAVYVMSGQNLDTVLSTIICQFKNCYFGMRLTNGDMNGDGKADVIVGSPWASFSGTEETGFVAIYYSSKNVKPLMSQLDADLVLSHNDKYDWFGYSLAYCQSEKRLFIGAPGGSITPMKRVPNGAVYSYSHSLGSMYLFGFGKRLNEQFGAAIACDGSYVAVGSPRGTVGLDPDSVGFVQVFPSNTGAMTFPLFTYNGTAPLGRFGARLAFARDDDGARTLLMAAPWNSPDADIWKSPAVGRVSFAAMTGPERGRLKHVQTGEVRAQLGHSIVAWRCVPTTSAGRGETRCQGSGDDVDGKVLQMIVGAPRTDESARQAGKLVFFENPSGRICSTRLKRSEA